MKTWQIVLLVLGCVFIGFLLLFGIPFLITTRSINSIMNDAREIEKKRTASLIVSGVEMAYTSAFIENNGRIPTLQQVKSYFNLDNVIWNNNYIIKTDDFDCDVKVVNNYLKVNCLDIETDTDMLLSN